MQGMKGMALLVLPLAALAVGAFVPATAEAAGAASTAQAAPSTSTPATWERIASELAGVPVSPVSCRRLPRDTLGITTVYRSRSSNRVVRASIVLDNGVCAQLQVAPKQGTWVPLDARYPRMAMFIAIQTLAHESMHARGIRDENRAECEGLGNFRRVARGLGFSASWAMTLGRFEVEFDKNLHCGL